MSNLVPVERIENKIYLIRGQKVMLDRDLAELYGVQTKVLNQAVKRNKSRFPSDFMFSLPRQEILRMSQFVTSSGIHAERSRSQFVTLKRGQNIKYAPYAFTEHGILMLSSVLNSPRAIHVNIQIMRTFTRLRQILATHKELREKIEQMERKYDKQFKVVFEYIKSLLNSDKGKGKIGFMK